MIHLKYFMKDKNYSSIINLGTTPIVSGRWNNGTFRYRMTNFGNDVLIMQWNASDPILNDSNIWTLNGTDFAIDDDNLFEDDTANLTFVYLNATQTYFNHSTGLEVCTSFACDNLALNETLDTYFHVFPPIGLKAGIYNTTIIVTLGAK